MVRRIVILVFLFSINMSWSQVEKGLLKATSTFSLGLQNENTQNYYLSGMISFQMDNRFSFRGDGFYFLGGSGNRVRFDHNHQVFAGLVAHFNLTDQLYFYTGLQPGVAYTRGTEYPTLNEDGTLSSKFAWNPVMSGLAGVTYYAPKWFHVFFETRYLTGKHQSDSYVVHLDEIRFSFGLGFHLNTLSK